MTKSKQQRINFWRWRVRQESSQRKWKDFRDFRIILFIISEEISLRVRYSYFVMSTCHKSCQLSYWLKMSSRQSAVSACVRCLMKWLKICQTCSALARAGLLPAAVFFVGWSMPFKIGDNDWICLRDLWNLLLYNGSRWSSVRARPRETVSNENGIRTHQWAKGKSIKSFDNLLNCSSLFFSSSRTNKS